MLSKDRIIEVLNKHKVNIEDTYPCLEEEHFAAVAQEIMEIDSTCCVIGCGKVAYFKISYSDFDGGGENLMCEAHLTNALWNSRKRMNTVTRLSRD